jgi:bla regulator protein blaR1
MQLFFTYCLKLSISLAVVSLFYQLVLRRLTFYKWNRYFLVGYSFLCFLISFIDISPLMERSSWTPPPVTTWIPVMHRVQIGKDTQNVFSLITLGNITGVVLLLGIGIMLVRLLLQLLSLRRLRSTAMVIAGEGPKVYEVKDFISPFSFGASIYVNKSLHTETELREIILHEFVHVRQRHSIDIMWSEIICALNWYNPFAWLLKFFIRQNLEFIADSEVLQAGINKKEYQYLLLKVMGNNQFSIVQNFNFSSLKKRIAMMNRSKTATLSVVRFLFILPLFVALLLAFRSIKPNRQEIRKGEDAPQTLVTTPTDTLPRSSASSRKSVDKERTVPIASDKYEISDDRAVIHLEDGRTEVYDLNDRQQKEKFKEKYPGVYDEITAKNIVVALTSDAPVSVEPAVAVGDVMRTVTSARITKTVTCNVSTSINSNISVVTSNCDAIAVPAATNVTSRAATVIAPVMVSEGRPAIADENGYTIEGNEDMLFSITKNTTRLQLDELKDQMKAKGVKLNFTEIKYNNDGKLVSITGTLESKDATGKFVATAFSKLIVYLINDGDHSYFRIDEQRAARRVI